MNAENRAPAAQFVSPAAGPSNAVREAESKLTTPPLSAAGSSHEPLFIPNSDESIGVIGSGSRSAHPSTTGLSKRRKASPQLEGMPDFLSSSREAKGNQPAVKRQKLEIFDFVAVPPRRRSSIKMAPSARLSEKKHAPSSPVRPELDDLSGFSSDSSLTSLSSDGDSPSGPRPRPAPRPRKQVTYTTRRNRPSLVPPANVHASREASFDLPFPPVEVDDGRDPSYVPSGRTFPGPTSFPKRPSRRHDVAPEQNPARKEKSKLKYPKPLSPVRPVNIYDKGPASRSESGPGTQQRPPESVPLRRVTLLLSPPSPVATSNDRLAGLTRCNVQVSDPILLRATVNRHRLAELYGGNAMRMCVTTSGRNFIFPTLKQNPRLPSDVGLQGLLLRANEEIEWKGDVQTVFVGLKGSHYRYMGEYRLTLGERLSAEEYMALLPSLRSKWARSIASKSKYKDIRVRIRIRRTHDREATAEEIAVALEDKEDKCEVTVEDVTSAYQSGQERMLVWRMQCVAFDEAFLADLVSRL
ncbi:hypothetical protein BD310DRAFT_924165 [Dichomitus squalens]|uniref:DUF6697 domain-containing protein n=1 Tax=Dichomitus squalens TaxID=114155 RepID=A0A4Q9PZK5_9APHY|nr:hypothetical protein BD310DRAFT_924165 [Dichomitus squalens]